MGMMKHKLEDKNALYGLAADILRRVGAIKTCEVHGDRCLVDELKLQDACKLANSWISKGIVDCGRRELTDAIKDVLETAPEECPSCANVMYDDD